jgi:hypothetical protein
MLKIKHLNAMCLAAATATILLVAGCQDNDDSNKLDTDRVDRLEHTQEAAGARAEATLYPQHFDGEALTTLGEAELDAMLADSHATNPLVVYIAVANDSHTDARRATVQKYLETHGNLTADQIQFQSGPNPGTYAPAAIQLSNYSKTSDAGESSGAAPAASGYGSGSGSGH